MAEQRRKISLTDSEARAVLYALSLATRHTELWDAFLEHHRHRATAAYERIAREYASQDVPKPRATPPRESGGEFAVWLREERRRLALEWTDIAARTGYAVSTIKMAASGHSSVALRANVRSVLSTSPSPEQTNE